MSRSKNRIWLIWIPVGFLISAAATALPRHPLDALEADEYVTVRDVLAAAGRTSEDSLFALIRLHEPAKQTILVWESGGPIPRVAFAVVRPGDYKVRCGLAGSR